MKQKDSERPIIRAHVHIFIYIAFTLKFIYIYFFSKILYFKLYSQKVHHCHH
jgi:hypothetical protein